MSSKKEMIAEVLRLSPTEQLEVVDAVYASLDGPADSDADQAWATEIATRIADLDAGRVKTIPWSSARRQIVGDDDAEVRE